MAKREKDEINVRIGAAIKEARKRRGLVTRHVAEAIGTTVGAVGNWESGQNAISSNLFFRLAEFLGIDARALMKGDLVYLEEPSSETQAATSEQASPAPHLIALFGEVLKQTPEFQDQIAGLLEARLKTVQSTLRASKTKHRL